MYIYIYIYIYIHVYIYIQIYNQTEREREQERASEWKHAYRYCICAREQENAHICIRHTPINILYFRAATHCNSLQHTVFQSCNTLQLTATYCISEPKKAHVHSIYVFTVYTYTVCICVLCVYTYTVCIYIYSMYIHIQYVYTYTVCICVLGIYTVRKCCVYYICVLQWERASERKHTYAVFSDPLFPFLSNCHCSLRSGPLNRLHASIGEKGKERIWRLQRKGEKRKGKKRGFDVCAPQLGHTLHWGRCAHPHTLRYGTLFTEVGAQTYA